MQQRYYERLIMLELETFKEVEFILEKHVIEQMEHSKKYRNDLRKMGYLALHKKPYKNKFEQEQHVDNK